MKKIGDIYTLRGQASEDESESKPDGIPIPLFDGRFDTGFKVLEFVVWGASFNTSTNPDVIGKLATEPNLQSGGSNFMNAADQREIAWSGVGGGTDTGSAGYFSVVDPDNMIIEDLYIYTRAVNDAVPVNYMVKLQKYDITEWQGALSMVRNRAQGSAPT